jgi:hypothetical protein
MDLAVTGTIGEVLADVDVAHKTGMVENEDRRTSDLTVLVPDAVAAADVALGIREKRERKQEFLDHRPVLFGRVDRYTVDHDSGLLEPPV